MPAHDDLPPNIHALPAQLAGVFATHVNVWIEPKTFTLDFVRQDPAAPDNAELVARVALSEFAMTAFADTIEDALGKYNRGEIGMNDEGSSGEDDQA